MVTSPKQRSFLSSASVPFLHQRVLCVRLRSGAYLSLLQPDVTPDHWIQSPQLTDLNMPPPGSHPSCNTSTCCFQEPSHSHLPVPLLTVPQHFVLSDDKEKQPQVVVCSLLTSTLDIAASFPNRVTWRGGSGTASEVGGVRNDELASKSPSPKVGSHEVPRNWFAVSSLGACDYLTAYLPSSLDVPLMPGLQYHTLQTPRAPFEVLINTRTKKAARSPCC